MARKANRVAVLCCVCGEPTTMLVPEKLLEEVQIMHICDRCAAEDVDVAQVLRDPDDEEPP